MHSSGVEPNACSARLQYVPSLMLGTLVALRCLSFDNQAAILKILGKQMNPVLDDTHSHSLTSLTSFASITSLTPSLTHSLTDPLHSLTASLSLSPSLGRFCYV